jgi:secreted PhoX family phosphatase
MKRNIILSAAGLMAICTMLSFPASAQNNNQPQSKSYVKIRTEKIVNGDTVITEKEYNGTGDMNIEDSTMGNGFNNFQFRSFGNTGDSAFYNNFPQMQDMFKNFNFDSNNMFFKNFEFPNFNYNFDVDSIIKEFNFRNLDSIFPELKNNRIIIKSYKDGQGSENDSAFDNRPGMDMQIYGRNDKGQDVMYKKKITIQDMGVADRNNNDRDMQLEVFPNPADTYFYISFQLDPDHETIITITDEDGKVLLKDSMDEAGGLYTRQFDLSSYKKGTYFVTIKQGKKEITKRIVVA